MRSTPTGGGHERHAARGASAGTAVERAATRPRGAEHATARDRRPAVRERPLPLVEIENASIWLGSRRVLRDFDWRIDPGQQWLVTGANGSGKSTLLRLLHGQLRPRSGGAIRWPGLGLPRNVWTLRRQVAWVSPELQAAYRYPTTVRDCVASGFESSFGLTRAPTALESDRVDELLAEFALDELATRLLTTLSYGQARRALIARALVNRPRLLLLDEPWEGLDEDASAVLNRALAATIVHGTQLVSALASCGASRAIHARDCARTGWLGTRRRDRDLSFVVVAVKPTNFAEVPPVRDCEQDARGHVHGHFEPRIPVVMTPQGDEQRARPPPRRRATTIRRCGGRDSPRRSRSRSSARRARASARGSGRRSPNVSATTGNSATTNGIARQCTMQIVDREIAIRSRYLDAAMGKNADGVSEQGR